MPNSTLPFTDWRWWAERYDKRVESDALRHGENTANIAELKRTIDDLRSKMDTLVGSGSIDGRIGTIQRDLENQAKRFEDSEKTRDERLTWLMRFVAGQGCILLIALGTFVLNVLSKKG